MTITLLVLVSLSKIASNTTTTNIKSFSLVSYIYKPVDIKNNNKVDDLPEISVEPIKKLKYTKNLSFKAHEILEEKVVVLAKELDLTKVNSLVAEIKEIKLLNLANLKEIMRQIN